MKKTITIIAVAAVCMMGCSPKSTNPFMEEWNTPYNVPPFDKIKTEHYVPAFEEGMKQQAKNVETIANNTEEPTFDNTILALENSGELLEKVSGVFFNLTECCNSPEMEEIANEMMPKLSQHSDNIYLNEKLFKRVKAVYDKQNSMELTPEQARLLEVTYKNFVRGGANIPADQQKRFREINERLSCSNGSRRISIFSDGTRPHVF